MKLKCCDHTPPKKVARRATPDHSTRSAIFPHIGWRRLASAPPAPDLHAPHGDCSHLARGTRIRLASVSYLPGEGAISMHSLHTRQEITQVEMVGRRPTLDLWRNVPFGGAPTGYPNGLNIRHTSECSNLKRSQMCRESIP